MDEDFLQTLDYARSLSPVPFRLTSAYRSPEYEKIMGRSGLSSHCKGLAVDIACPNGRYRLAIIDSLLDAGFTRLGFGKGFIHVDMDKDKNNSCWLYE